VGGLGRARRDDHPKRGIRFLVTRVDASNSLDIPVWIALQGHYSSFDRLSVGTIDLPVVPIGRRWVCLRRRANQWFLFARLGPARGAYASSRTLGSGCDGREAAHETNALISRTAKSCGPDASMPASRWRRCLRIALATVATKPDHRGEYEAAVKTIRAGKVEPIDFACGDCRVLFVARKPRAHRRPAFPAPSIRATRFRIARANHRCGI
jgi:hypothetical protein